MSALHEGIHRPEQDRTTRPSVSLVIAVMAVLAVAGIAWIAAGDDGPSDIEVATELVDTFARGWVENDPDAVGSVFTDDAVYSDDVEGFAFPGVRNKDETMQDVRNRDDAVIDARRVGELTATGDGTFTYVAEMTIAGKGRYSGVVEIELDGNLASRIEWLNLEFMGADG